MDSNNTSAALARPNLRVRLQAWWAGVSEPRRRHLKGLLIYLLLLLLAFSKPLIYLVGYTLRTELHSHVPLIPFVSAWLLSINQDRLPADYRRSSGWALCWALAGLAMLVLAWVLPSMVTKVSHNDSFGPVIFSLICFIYAGAFFFLGSGWMKQAIFPAFFLIFMIPLPDPLVRLMEAASQHASAEATNWILHISGVPWLRDAENPMIFHFPGLSLRVAEECSGAERIALFWL